MAIETCVKVFRIALRRQSFTRAGSEAQESGHCFLAHHPARATENGSVVEIVQVGFIAGLLVLKIASSMPASSKLCISSLSVRSCLRAMMTSDAFAAVGTVWRSEGHHGEHGAVAARQRPGKVQGARALMYIRFSGDPPL